jgi:hypothetical protein
MDERVDGSDREPTGNVNWIETQQIAPLHVRNPPFRNETANVPDTHPEMVSDLANADQPRQLSAAGWRPCSFPLTGVGSLGDVYRGRRLGQRSIDRGSVGGTRGLSVHARLKVAVDAKARHCGPARSRRQVR